MTTRGFYSFACRDMPEVYHRHPQLNPETTKIRVQGEDEDDARRAVTELVRGKMAEAGLGGLLEPITAKPVTFRPFNIPKEPKA